MAKVLLSLDGGAVQLVENSGVYSLKLDKSASLGGGKAAGLLKVEGDGSVDLDLDGVLLLSEALANAHVPAALLPAAEAVEGIANAAVKALE